MAIEVRRLYTYIGLQVEDYIYQHRKEERRDEFFDEKLQYREGDLMEWKDVQDVYQ